MPNRNHAIWKQSFGGKGLNPEALENFKSDLERFFFAETHISFANPEKTELIVSLSCNFGITESLFHLNSGNWGGFMRDEKYRSEFDNSFDRLKKYYDARIDISEFSMNFSDTSLIITKLYQFSIPDYLNVILTSISEHFVHFTKELTEMPYEIFVPVFMEDVKTPMLEKLQNKTLNTPKNYFDYWGLYFASKNNADASIYDVKEKRIIEGDFFLLDF